MAPRSAGPGTMTLQHCLVPHPMSIARTHPQVRLHVRLFSKPQRNDHHLFAAHVGACTMFASICSMTVFGAASPATLRNIFIREERAPQMPVVGVGVMRGWSGVKRTVAGCAIPATKQMVADCCLKVTIPGLLVAVQQMISFPGFNGRVLCG